MKAAGFSHGENDLCEAWERKKAADHEAKLQGCSWSGTWLTWLTPSMCSKQGFASKSVDFSLQV